MTSLPRNSRRALSRSTSRTGRRCGRSSGWVPPRPVGRRRMRRRCSLKGSVADADRRHRRASVQGHRCLPRRRARTRRGRASRGRHARSRRAVPIRAGAQAGHVIRSDLRLAGEPEEMPALTRVVMPEISQSPYRVYPLVDHVADKVIATFEPAATVEAGSQIKAIGSQASRRGWRGSPLTASDRT